MENKYSGPILKMIAFGLLALVLLIGFAKESSKLDNGFTLPNIIIMALLILILDQLVEIKKIRK